MTAVVNPPLGVTASARRTRLDAVPAQAARPTAPSVDPGLAAWVTDVAALTQPDAVVWIDGSLPEWDRLTGKLVDAGTFIRLAAKPNSFYAASDPDDVARVEDRTFICSVDAADAGATNNWMAPDEMKAIMTDLYRGSMRGRTMYVVPFCMGPFDAEVPMLGVEITDSEYVVASMRIMTRVGTRALDLINSGATWVQGPPFGRGALAAGRCRREMALQFHQIHHPVPRGKGHLVVRFRLWRKCPARQEVLLAADRVGHRP